jgi:hypothetical protein
MTDCELERRNAEAIGHVSNRRLETIEVDVEPCKECGGRGTALGSDDENSYGRACSKGCKLDRSRFTKRADLAQIGDPT